MKSNTMEESSRACNSDDDGEEYPRELRDVAMAAFTLCTIKNTNLETQKATTQVNMIYQFKPNYTKDHRTPDGTPPVQKLYGLIGEFSQPYRRLLTVTDLNPNQNRLNISKNFAQEILVPMLKDGENLRSGIDVNTYDSEGHVYNLVFKIRAGERNYVLNGMEWKQFVKDHELIPEKDYVEVWMFRHLLTKKLCFIINPQRTTQIDSTSKGTNLPPKVFKRRAQQKV